MALKPFDYTYGAQPTNEQPAEEPTSGIKPFSYETAPTVTPPVVTKGNEILPIVPAKPTFKSFSDLTTKQKASAGTTRAVMGTASGLAQSVAGTVEAVSTGKDVLFGAGKDFFNPQTIEMMNTSTTANTTPSYSVTKEGMKRSAKAGELATDTNFDKKVKEIAQMYTNLGESEAQVVKDKKAELGLNPEDTLVDQVFQGAGQMLGFVATGYTGKVLTSSLGFAKQASSIANTGNTILESLMEAQEVYKENKAQGKSDEEAYDAFQNDLISNAILIPVTNALGGMFEDTSYKGVKRMFKAVGSGLMEGGQEAVQTMVSNYNTGKPVMEGVKESFIIGALLGVPASLALDLGISTHQNVSDEKKKEIEAKIDEMPVSEENKQAVKDIISGNITEEEKGKALIQAISDPNFGIVLDENTTPAIKEDISNLIDEGHDIAIIADTLYNMGVKQEDAQNLIAEVNVAKQTEQVVQKEQQQAEQAVKTPEQARVEEVAQREAQQPLSEGRKMAIDEVNYYLGASEAGYRQFTLENDSMDYKITAVSSTFPQWVPDNMRSRKTFDAIKPYWAKQERPSNRTPKLQKLYDLFQYHVNKQEAKHQAKIDSAMVGEKTDEYAFKEKGDNKSPVMEGGRREIAVLKDFQARYKVDFPIYAVKDIIGDTLSTVYEGQFLRGEGVTDGNSVAITYDAVVNTGIHELVHLTLQHLDLFPSLKGITKEQILTAKEAELNKEGRRNPQISVEEQLALDMENYRNDAYKPANSILQRFYKALGDFLNNFRKAIVKSNGDIVREFYDAVKYGKTDRTYKLSLEDNSQIAKYLINDVLDYSPKATAVRKLSITNGLTSLEYKETDGQEHFDPEEISKALANSLRNKPTGKFDKPGRFKDEGYSYKEAKTGLAENGEYMKGRIVIGQDDRNNLIIKDGTHLLEAYRELDIAIPADKIAFEDGVEMQYVLPGYTPPVDRKRSKTTGRFVPQFKEALDKTTDLYKESGVLTTKVLTMLEGRKTVSKQFIADAIKREGIKQVERDLISQVLTRFESAINVEEFAKAVQAELLPLSVQGVKADKKAQEAELNRKGIFVEEDMSGEVNIVDGNGDFVDYQTLDDETRKLYDKFLGSASDYSSIVSQKYDYVVLPKNQRGSVKNYEEHIYESPIATSAGNVHFPSSDNYFGHTRIEDMASTEIDDVVGFNTGRIKEKPASGVRRVIEVQSDLYQKGRLEQELPFYGKKPQGIIETGKKFDNGELEYALFDTDGGFLQSGNKERVQRTLDDTNKKNIDVAKLSQYSDPTAHFRMIREEIRRAAIDGKTKLQFPTGETAMKIEGLGTREDAWAYLNPDENANETWLYLKPETLEVGKEVADSSFGNWIITDVLGDGKFKAVPKSEWESAQDIIEVLRQDKALREHKLNGGSESTMDFSKVPKATKEDILKEIQISRIEEFDISGKVDTNNPIFKFYEKEVAKYLRNNYKSELVTDDKGITWNEVAITPEQKGAVLAFKEKAQAESNMPKTVKVWRKSRFNDGGGYVEVPIIRREDNITLYQGGSDGKRQFWTPDRKYAEQFGDVQEKTGSFYRVDNGNRMTDVYIEAPKEQEEQAQADDTNVLREGEYPIKTSGDYVEKVARERFKIDQLPKISFGGSDRDVYDLGNNRVLKVAKSSRGLTQNEYSHDYYAEDNGLIPKTFEYGDNYVVKEKVLPPDVATKKMVKEIADLGRGYDLPDRGGKVFEIMNKYGYPGEELMNYNPLWGDIKVVRNWGTTVEGKPVMLDEGTLNGDLVTGNKVGGRNLDDPEFRAIYERSRAAKKQYGDRDSKTMYKEKSQQQSNEALVKKYFPKYYEAYQKRITPQKVSRAYSRVKDRLAEEYQKDVTYTPIKIADQTAKAMELIRQDPEYAKAIALGLDNPPLDITETAVSIAVSEMAREAKDYALQAETEKARSLRQSRRGQEIVSERGRLDENSPGYFIQQVLDRRKQLVAEQYTPLFNKAKPFMDILDEQVEKKVKKTRVKSQLELKVEDFESFLDSVAC